MSPSSAAWIGGRNNNAGVEIDRVFGFVGEMRRAILHLGDLGVRIGLAHPILVRELLALAPTIETDEIVGVSTPLSSAIHVSISR